MFQPNDPVGISVQMSAKLFAIMADEVLQACGEDKGEEIVRRAVRRYAELRAAGIRKEILDAGKEVTFETVEEFSDYPPNDAWDCQTDISDKQLHEITYACPFSTAFREIGLEYAGSLYCKEIDITLYKDGSVSVKDDGRGDIDFARPQIFNTNDKGICEMIVTRKAKTT